MKGFSKIWLRFWKSPFLGVVKWNVFLSVCSKSSRSRSILHNVLLVYELELWPRYTRCLMCKSGRSASFDRLRWLYVQLCCAWITSMVGRSHLCNLTRSSGCKYCDNPEKNERSAHICSRNMTSQRLSTWQRNIGLHEKEYRFRRRR